MANLIKSVKVNGTQYGIDYESLENKPIYKNVTLGEYLLPETEITAPDTDEPVSINIQSEIEKGETLLFMLDGEECECIGYVEDYSDPKLGSVNIGFSCFIPAAGENQSISLWWSKTGESWDGGSITFPPHMAGTHTVSLRRYSKEIKKLDSDFLGCLNATSDESTITHEKNLKTTDLIGNILKMGFDCYFIVGAGKLSNGFIGLMSTANGSPLTYNPFSGMIGLVAPNAAIFDVTQTYENDNYTEDSFEGSALVYGDGDPVMVVWAHELSSVGVWQLGIAEDYMYDADGEVVHNAYDPIRFDPSTGTFTLTAEPTMFSPGDTPGVDGGDK